MMLRFSFLLAMTMLFVACSSSTDTETIAADQTDEATTEVAASAETEEKVFGAQADFSDPISYDDMVIKLAEASTDTMMVTVAGTVNDVCQVKGCWITIGGEEEMMVKFKDYGFFMPKDIGGRDVVMHGKAYYQVTPVDELRHYAEDAGKSAEEIAAIVDAKKELRFMADGVLLRN